MAKHSIHSLDRFRHGIAPTKKFGPEIGRNVSLFTESDDPFLSDVPVKAVLRDGNYAYDFEPHLIFELKDDPKQPLRLTKADFHSHLSTVNLDNLSGKFKAFALRQEDEDELMELAHHTFSSLGLNIESAGHYLPGTLPIFGEVEFGMREFRTFAKIAFNYAAKMTEEIPSFILQPCFDEVREFIRFDASPERAIVEQIGNVGQRTVLGGAKYVISHFAALSLSREKIHWTIECKVTLFNLFGWRVNLCPDYRGLHFDLNRAHHWDFETMTCVPFGGGIVSTVFN